MAKKKETRRQDETHAQLLRWVTESEDATLESRTVSERCRDYYDSKQLTAGEMKALERRGQAPVVINRIKPKLDGLMGMERQNRTTAKAYPRTPKHQGGANAATESVRFVLNDNMYAQVRSAMWDFLLSEGTGGCEIIAEASKEDFRIRINAIHWDRIIYDPHSRRKDFSDARYLGQVVWMDYDEAAERYPQAREIIESMQEGSSTYGDKPRWMDNTRRRCKVVELYWKQSGDVHYGCFTYGGWCEPAKISPYKNEENETVWPYEFGSLFVDREGQRYGAAKQLLDVQDEINKRRSKALHLMSVRQIRLEKGSVDDVNKVRQELAKPDGVVETVQGMEFEVLKTGDMAAAQFNLLTEAKAEIDHVGYNAAAQGKDERLQSGVALRTRELAGQTEVAPMFDVLKHLDLRVYRKVWNCVRQYWRAEKWIRVTDDENTLRWVGLNKPVTQGETLLRQASEQGAPPEALRQLQARMAEDPAMKEVVSTENDLAELDVDIVMADAPDTVTQQIEDFQVLGEMVKSGFPMPPIAVIEASPLSNKERIIKMMQEQPQLPPQVQEQMKQAQEQTQKLQEEHRRMAEENQALKQDRGVEAAKLQADAQAEEAKLQLKARMQEQELELERRKAAAEIELEKARAQADMEMQALKMQHEREQKGAQMEFEHSCKLSEMIPDDAKRQFYENKVAETSVMPKLMEGLQAAFAQIGAVLEKQLALQQDTLALQKATLAAFERPRRIAIESVSRAPDGSITGAAITPTMQ